MEWFTSHDIKWWFSWNALAKDLVKWFAYNVETIPYRYSLEKIKKKSTNCDHEYAYTWRKEAFWVRPLMSEKEIVEVFI